MKCFLLFAVLLAIALTSAHVAAPFAAGENLPSLSKRQASPWQEPQPPALELGRTWFIGRIGRYGIAVPREELGDNFRSLLDKLYKALQGIIADAERSQTNPSAAFMTFFKTRTSAVAVAQLFRYITAGTAVYPAQEPLSNGSPTFAYVDKTSPPALLTFADGSKHTAADVCRDIRPLRQRAFVLEKGPMIFLCEDFLTEHPRLPPPLGYAACPSLTRLRYDFHWDQLENPVFNGQRLVQSQLWVMLEMIVQYHLNAKPKKLSPQRRSINDAWLLTAEDSLLNGMNYVYYAAGKSPTPMSGSCGVDSTWHQL